MTSLALSMLGPEAFAQEQAAPLLGSAATDQVYAAVSPCRFVDGISAADRIAIAANSTTARYYKVRGNISSDFVSQGAAGSAPNGCGIPTTATAVMVNLTIVDPDQDGDLRADPAHVSTPSLTSVLNYTFGNRRGNNLANGVIVPLCDLSLSTCSSGATPASPTRDLLVTFHAGVTAGSTYFIADVLGYFAPASGFVTSVNALGGAVTLAGGSNVTVTPAGNTLTIAASAAGVTSVSASSPLASSGGTTPDISLSGVVPVASGGTGQPGLATNGVLVGQGIGPVGVAVGVAGDVLTGTAGAPLWTGSPSLSGTLTLVSSTPTTGNIFKNGNRFIHNSGNNDTFIGVNAGNFTMAGADNTAGGANALQSNTIGNTNTASGSGALQLNTAGNSNTASGAFALQLNTTGSSNTASGAFALAANTVGNNNTASGRGALFLNTTGNLNTASGENALRNNTTGNANTASGVSALSNNTTGVNNTASGVDALSNNTTGINNTASGASALLHNTTGDDNTAGGGNALLENTTGNRNIGVGFNAGSFLTTGSDNIDIGNTGLSGESSTIRIGTLGTHTSAFIAGARGTVTGIADSIPLLIDSAGQLGTISSSRRFKDDIADMGDASSVLMKMRPVTFHYKADQDPAGRRLQYGLIAEEVAELNPGLVARSADGQLETVLYQFLPPMLLSEIQKQQRTIAAQADQLGRQKARIAELERQAARVEALLERLSLTDAGSR